MLRGQKSRRIAALLTAALVAMLLVAAGGAAHTTGHRTTVGSTHAFTTAQAQRAAHPISRHHADPQVHLDLATGPATDALKAPSRSYAPPTTVDTRVGRDLAPPTGRGPPAL